jgi:predicted nucleotide-binding protein (sugar kinase/HSP70/actin superfamily)
MASWLRESLDWSNYDMSEKADRNSKKAKAAGSKAKAAMAKARAKQAQQIAKQLERRAEQAKREEAIETTAALRDIAEELVSIGKSHGKTVDQTKELVKMYNMLSDDDKKTACEWIGLLW